MSTINMAEKIKLLHPEFFISYRVGAFYNSYGKDAYILEHLFGYKTRKSKNDIPLTGFPKNAISRVMAKLENKKINYMIVDARNNYYVDIKEDYGNLNNYSKILEKSLEYIKYKRRTDKIASELLKQKNIEKIREVEKIIYENRKI